MLSQPTEPNIARKKTAVIIDDDPDSCALMAACLGQIPGWTCVRTFATGVDALRQIDHLKPDVVLVDALMPDMWGVEITQQLKTRRHRTRIILLTGLPEREALVMAQQAGADDLLLKSFSPDDLVRVLTSSRSHHFWPPKGQPRDAAEALAMVDPRLAVPAFSTGHAFVEWGQNKQVPWYWLQSAQQSDFNVAKLAAWYHWPSRHLNHEWHNLFLESVGRWLHRVRMVLAVYRLWEGKKSTAVAAELKYSQPHHFNRAFHRFFHATPDDFVEKLHGLDWLACSEWLIPCSKWLIDADSPNPDLPEQASTGKQAKLTPREAEVVKLAAEDSTSKGIAERLKIAPNTVDWHWKRIRRKAHVPTRRDIIVNYIKHVRLG